MDASKLRKGQKVKITFEGIIALADYGSVSLKHPDGPSMPITWSDRLSPEIEILDPGYQDGDIGVYDYGSRETVVYRGSRCAPHPSNQILPEGWYSTRAGHFSRVAAPRDKHVTLLIRADGTMVED